MLKMTAKSSIVIALFNWRRGKRFAFRKEFSSLSTNLSCGIWSKVEKRCEVNNVNGSSVEQLR
jgi:hypothetical protein